jgi:hypothetical protein
VQKVACALIALGATTAIAAPALAEMVVIEPAQPPPKFPQPPPGPPPQVAKLSQQLAGTWKCKGSYRDETGVTRALASTTTIALRLDGAWLELATATRVGETTTRSIEYRSFDVVAKQWTRVVLASDMRHVVQTSVGEVNGTWTWTGGGASDAQRIAKDAVATWRETNGEKTYESTCRR